MQGNSIILNILRDGGFNSERIFITRNILLLLRKAWRFQIMEMQFHLCKLVP